MRAALIRTLSGIKFDLGIHDRFVVPDRLETLEFELDFKS